MPRRPQNPPRLKPNRNRGNNRGPSRGRAVGPSPNSLAKSTRSILDELFTHPPVSRAELEQRLAPASVVEARRVLIERLTQGPIEESDGDLFVSVFHILGIGNESQPLLNVVADSRRPRHVRAYALTVLLHADPLYSDKLREVVSEEELLSLAAQPMCQFLCHIESNPDEAEQLALTLESAPEDLRFALFEQLDRFRKESGVPAAVAYEGVLGRPLLAALRPTILEALGSEGGTDAIALIEKQRQETKDLKTQRTLQGLLLRLRTRILEGRTRALGKTRAYISSCDGQSAFFVLGERENPDATHTLALLCIRAAGDVRDGYVATRQPQSQVRTLLGRFTTDAGTEFVEVPLGRAAPLIEQAIARTLAEGRKLPEDALPALRFFQRVEPLELPAITPAERLSLAALRPLLREPPYKRSWFVDPSDLEASGVKPPKTNRPTAAWLAQATRRLAQNAVLMQRVAAMARHMAVWHKLRNEDQAAALCIAAAEATEQEPEKSPLLRVLLERLFAPSAQHSASEEPNHDPLGEPTRRQFLKSRFFLDVAAPKGRDLALLDFTEAALLAFERALETIPGDARPREDVMQEVAHGMARLFRDYVLLSRNSPPLLLGERMAELIAAASHLPPEECHRLSLMLLAALVSFVDEVCGDCPVRCISRPRADVAAAFFSPMHPALSRPEPPRPQPTEP